MRHSGCQNKPLRLRSGVYAFVVCFARIFSLSLCYLCAIYMLMLGTGFCSMLSLCYLCAIYAISCWGLLFALCYLCAISVLSMLSHAGGYFLRYAISVLSLCYLCYLMLSLCYLCATYMIFLVNLRRHTQIQA